MYTLRFPFRFAAGQQLEVDGVPFALGTLQCHLSTWAGWHVATIDGFETEAQARDYVQSFWTVLLWVQLHANLAPQASLDVREVRRLPDPVAAAANFKRHGVDTSGPVHGVADGASPIVYPTGQNIRVPTAGGLDSVTEVTSVERFKRLLQEFAQLTNRPSPISDDRLRLALELYKSHFSEASISGRFLTLVMALEVLSPRALRPKPILDLIQGWQEDIERLRPSLSADEEYRVALESIARDVVFKRELSIRSQIRALVLGTLRDAGHPDAEGAARTAVKLYDNRSTLVHQGVLQDDLLRRSFADAKQIVREVLTARFKLHVSASA